MDILTGERSAKLDYRYLRASDQEKVTHEADEDLFPVEVSATLRLNNLTDSVACCIPHGPWFSPWIFHWHLMYSFRDFNVNASEHSGYTVIL